MTLTEIFFPFAEYDFLSHALLASVVLSFSAAPLGVFLLLKRLSLVGDALSHSILPGVAVGYFLFGFSLPGMTFGGFFAGVLIILISHWVSQKTHLKQETSFAAFYLISLALGVLLISSKGSQVDLIHVLFGNLLALDQATLILISVVAGFTVIFFALAFKPLILEAFDQEFYQVKIMKYQGWRRSLLQSVPFLFLIMLVLNLVSSFHAIGTLLSLGLIILPAATASLWVKTIGRLILTSLLISISSSYAGLLLSYHFDLSVGPTIVACIGAVYSASLIARHPLKQLFQLMTMKNPEKSKVVATSVALIFLLTLSLAPSLTAKEPQKISVITTFSILHDLTSQLAPAHFEVSTLVEPDQDAHTYQPKPSDLKRLKNAQLVILNGLGFELWADKLLSANQFKGQKVIATTGIKTLMAPGEHSDHHHDDHHDHGEQDPHAWHNPENIRIYISQIEKALIELSPSQEKEIHQRATDYLRLVNEKHQTYKAKYAALNEEKRKVITNHDSFQYYGNAYGIRFLSAQGVSTESEPTAKNIARLIKQIRKEQIKCLFVETTSNPKVLEQITSETKTRLGGKLTSDSLSKKSPRTYLEMMDQNFQQIYGCLSSP